MTCHACHQPICGHPDAIYSGSIPAAGVVMVRGVAHELVEFEGCAPPVIADARRPQFHDRSNAR